MAAGPAAALLENWEPSKREETRRRRKATLMIEDAFLNGQFQPLGLAAHRPGCGWLRLAVRSTIRPMQARDRQSGITPGYPAVLSSLGAIQVLSGSDTKMQKAEFLSRALVVLPIHSFVESDWRSCDR